MASSVCWPSRARPSIVSIFDYGRTHDGVFYYAMELLDGATLQRIVETDGAQAPGRVVRILIMACGAKAPEDRPQSAADLRRQLEACAVQPWDSDAAEAWWEKQHTALETRAVQRSGETRTLAVDRSSRSGDRAHP